MLALQFENEIQQMDQSLRSIRAKSKHTILALQSELEDERKARVWPFEKAYIDHS